MATEQVGKVEQVAGKAVNRIFVSDEITSTGSEQTISHGLGRKPKLSFAFPTETSDAYDPNFDIDEGTHDAEHVKFTVTGGPIKFRVWAFA
jgi:hypothetical protein